MDTRNTVKNRDNAKTRSIEDRDYLHIKKMIDFENKK